MINHHKNVRANISLKVSLIFPYGYLSTSTKTLAPFSQIQQHSTVKDHHATHLHRALVHHSWTWSTPLSQVRQAAGRRGDWGTKQQSSPEQRLTSTSKLGNQQGALRLKSKPVKLPLNFNAELKAKKRASMGNRTINDIVSPFGASEIALASMKAYAPVNPEQNATDSKRQTSQAT